MGHIIIQLKKFRTDAFYEKKKHYNAAKRKRNYYNFTSIGQIILNAVTGTSILVVIFGTNNKIAEIIALCLTLLATIFAGVQKAQDFKSQAQGNSGVGDMYLEIMKFINLTLSMIEDNLLSNDEIIKRADEIRVNISKANKIGSQFPTNNKDYKKAKLGIKNGDESYTEEELEI